MKSNLLLFSLILILFTACQSNEADSKVEKTPQTTKAAPKVDPAQSQLDFVRENPNDHEMAGKKLQEAADIYLKKNLYPKALASLNQAIRNHFVSSATPQNALLMADIYKNNYKKPDLAQVVYQSANSSFPNDVAVQKAVAENKITIPAIDKLLGQYSDQLTNKETGKIDVKVANNFVAAAEIHAMLQPDDSENPNNLHKAGEIARSMRAFPKAIDIYSWIYTQYPESNKAAQSLFMSAFTYDNELKQVDKAKALYNEFLKRYPNDDFADDTKFLLEHLGKSNEEIIEGFAKQK